MCAVKGGDQAQETDDLTQSSKTQSASLGFLGLGSGTVYFDAYAKASTGCTFLGWAESEKGPVTVSDNPYKKSPITGRGGSKPLWTLLEENFTPFTITFGAGAYTVNGAAPATMGDVVKRTTLKLAASDPLFKEWGSRRGAAVPKAGSGRARGGTARGRPFPRDA